MTDIDSGIDHDTEQDTARETGAPTARRGPDYVPTFGDSPEGTDVWQRVPYNADDYGPVADFATDFDHADPAYNANAPQVWKELRESGCPVAHSTATAGCGCPSRTRRSTRSRTTPSTSRVAR
jgi:hypothetical protein